MSTAFGCPYEGDVAPERVAQLAGHLIDAGADRLSFGDTTGMATPRAGRRSARRARSGRCAAVEPVDRRPMQRREAGSVDEVEAAARPATASDEMSVSRLVSPSSTTVRGTRAAAARAGAAAHGGLRRGRSSPGPGTSSEQRAGEALARAAPLSLRRASARAARSTRARRPPAGALGRRRRRSGRAVHQQHREPGAHAHGEAVRPRGAVGDAEHDEPGHHQDGREGRSGSRSWADRGDDARRHGGDDQHRERGAPARGTLWGAAPLRARRPLAAGRSCAAGRARCGRRTAGRARRGARPRGSRGRRSPPSAARVTGCPPPAAAPGRARPRLACGTAATRTSGPCA